MAGALLLTLLAIVLLVVAVLMIFVLPRPLDVWRRFRTRFKDGRPLQGPYSFPFGNLVWALTDFEGEARHTINTYRKDGAYMFWCAGEPVLQFVNLDWLKQLLNMGPRAYERTMYFAPALKRMMGESLFTKSGDDWKRHHTILYRAFTPKNQALFVPIMQKNALKWMEQRLRAHAEKGDVVDMLEEFSTLSNYVAVECILGDIPQEEKDKVVQAFGFLMKGLNDPEHNFPILQYFPIPSVKRFNSNLEFLRDWFSRAIAKRRTAIELGVPEHDGALLIDLVLNAQDSGDSLSEAEARDTCISFVLAGTETTASSMTSVVHNMIHNPKELEKCLEQFAKANVNWDALTVDDFPQFQHLFMCIEETLRLMPPAPGVFDRTTVKEEVFGDQLVVPKGVRINTNSWVCHRNPDVWDNADEFRPERFLPEEVKKRHPYSYMPFGLGRRQCMGKIFAYNEMYTVLSLLFRKFTFTATQPPQPMAFQFPVMSLKGGLHVKIGLRK